MKFKNRKVNKMSRYRFIVHDNKVICISSFARKNIKGIAKCAPNDNFDIEIGKKLAQLRCDKKVADKRADRAAQKYIEAEDQLYEAFHNFENIKSYYFDSEAQYQKAEKALFDFESKLLN